MEGGPLIGIIESVRNFWRVPGCYSVFPLLLNSALSLVASAKSVREFL